MSEQVLSWTKRIDVQSQESIADKHSGKQRV